ncbi:MAG: hypothetical protein ACI4HI_02665 [Lachnospiraceae bacterium]
MMRKVYMKVYQWASIGFFSAAAVWLFLMSVCGTCFFVAPTERTAFKRDAVWLNILVLAGGLILIYFAYKNQKIRSLAEKITNDPKTYRKVKTGLLCIYGIFAFLFVIGTQYVPRADQEYVLDAAYQLKIGNYDMWKKGGYMEMYSNQNGIVLILYLFSLIFGDKNFLAFQLLNAVVLVVLMKQMMDISGVLGTSKTGQLVVGLLQIIYCPLLFYTFFVYGNIIGLSLSLFAIQSEWNYFDSKEKKYAVYAAVGIAMAVMIKNNYLIFMLGMLVYALGEVIGKKQWRGLIFGLGILAAFFGQKTMTQMIVENVTGQELEGGASSFAWIAMGLQEGGYLPDGWYNNYVPDSYAQANYDRDVQAEMNKEEIKNRLTFFKENKEQTQKFIYRKLSSEWNNPSFQGMCISQGCETHIEPNALISWVMSPKGSYLLTAFWKYIQFFILAGVLLFLLGGCYKMAGEKSLVLLVTFVGGFLFHMFWEAKAQYTISYFVMLFPLAWIGVQNACHCVNQWIKHDKESGLYMFKKKKNRVKCVLLLVGIILTIALPDVRKLYYPSEDVINFAEYEQEMLQENNSEGKE